MSNPVPPDARTSTGHLLFTLLLGFLIGFSVCYVFLGAPGLSETETTPVAEETAAPSAALPEPAAVPSQPVAPSPSTEPSAPAPVEDSLWPGGHLIITVSGTTLTDEEAPLIHEVLPGGILLTPDNLADAAQTKALVERLKSAEGLSDSDPRWPLILVAPSDLPDVPSLAEAGSWQSTEVARETARAYAKACKVRGIDALLGPNLSGPESMNAADRVAASERLTAMGLAFADELMKQDVVAVATVYPGAGESKPDVAVPVIDTDIRGLSERLYPFSEALAQGIPGLLVGSAAVPVMDKEQPNLPAALSPKLVRVVLRDKWRYDGVIIAQDVTALPGKGPETAVVQALGAGCDAVILKTTDPAVVRSACAAIEQAVTAGYLSKQQLVDSKRRLSGWLAWLREPVGLKGPLPVLKAPAAPKPVPSAPAPETQPTPEVAPQEPPAPEAQPEPAPTPEPKPEPAEVTPPPNSKKITYEIQQGDRLARIAAKYDVSVDDVVAWNKLKDADDIKYGQRLTIYVPDTEPKEAPAPAPEPESAKPTPEPAPSEPTAPAEAAAPAPAAPPAQAAEPETPPAAPEAGEPSPPEEKPAAEPAPAAAPSQAPEAQPEASTTTPPAEPAAASTDEQSSETAGLEKIRHRVEPGETLRSIGRRYGVSYRDIMKWNDLQDASIIKSGQRLTIYVPAPAPSTDETSAPQGE